jgi:cell division protein FtsQ
MWVRVMSFCFWIVLSIAMIVLSWNRNYVRSVQVFHVQIDENYPRIISKDSVDKMLKLVLKDSTSKQKSEIHLKSLELQLAQNDLIKKTEAFLTLNDVLHIKVLPRIPVAHIKGKSEFYLDSDGRPIPLSPTYDSEVPTIINDPDVDRYETLSVLSIAITEDVFLASHIGDIEDHGDEVSMRVIDQNYLIKIKSVDDIQTKFKNYKAFYALATDQGSIGDFKEVALDYSNQIICKRNTL